uniref:Uncharacterized protein n=1 Tax=Caenorhabditis tropicalis TaxID=1561998 RepID=A0A1I7TVK7_9PELO
MWMSTSFFGGSDMRIQKTTWKKKKKEMTMTKNRRRRRKCLVDVGEKLERRRPTQGAALWSTSSSSSLENLCSAGAHGAHGKGGA